MPFPKSFQNTLDVLDGFGILRPFAVLLIIAGPAPPADGSHQGDTGTPLATESLLDGARAFTEKRYHHASPFCIGMSDTRLAARHRAAATNSADILAGAL